MDNHIFRSAIGGFHRQDVIDYIERTQKQSEESIAWLESQVEQLQQSENDAQMALQECEQERDRLTAQLEEMTSRYNNAKSNWESQAKARESSRRDVVQRDTTIREMTEENQRLFHRIEELTGSMDDLQKQKLQLAQLELDAHRRADQVLAEAESEAQKTTAAAAAKAAEILTQAQTKAAGIVAQAETRSKAVVHETRLCMEDTVEDYKEILQTFQDVSSRISGDLKSLDRTIAEFPVGLNGLKKDFEELLERITTADAGQSQKQTAGKQ